MSERIRCKWCGMTFREELPPVTRGGPWGEWLVCPETKCKRSLHAIGGRERADCIVRVRPDSDGGLDTSPSREAAIAAQLARIRGVKNMGEAEASP